MIKKILITLLILIVIAVAGVVSLVVFVDPNNFKGFISETVKDKTGYELTIDGDLRWHIWPQISILTDSVRLEDEGAKKAILTADNMRLDVELFPLFSKELAVKNVLVKAAIINVTDESKGKVAKGVKSTTTVNQTPATSPSDEATNNDIGWTFSLNKLEIADSTVVLQQNKDIISFRDINVSIIQKDEQNIAVDLSGNVNRDQQDFIYSLNADINLSQFPQKAAVELHSLSYDYKGVGVPTGQLKGQVKATFNYQQSPLTLDSKNFVLTLNGNQIDGQLKADLDKKPYFEALFKSKKFDLSPFLAGEGNNGDVSDSQSPNTPVVAAKSAKGNELAFLRDFDAKFSLTVDEVLVNKVVVNNFVIDANNKNGIATLNNVNLDIAKGHIKADGIANGKQATTSIKLKTNVKDIDMEVLLSQLGVGKHLSGVFNAEGNIAINTLMPEKIMTALTGDLAVSVENARLESFNIQDIIQVAVANSKYMKDVVTPENQQKYTQFHKISAKAHLEDGNMNLSEMKALSETLNVNGDGRIGLSKQDLDINLKVQILNGWNGKSETIAKLQKVIMPLRIYGSFSELHYQLEVDKIIKNLLNDKIQHGLDKLKDRLKGNDENSSKSDSTGEDKPATETDNRTDKQKAKDLLGGFLNKIKDDKK